MDFFIIKAKFKESTFNFYHSLSKAMIIKMFALLFLI